MKSLRCAVLGVGLGLLFSACDHGHGALSLPRANTDAATDAGDRRDAARSDGGTDLPRADVPRIADLRMADGSGADLSLGSDASGKDVGVDAPPGGGADTQEEILPAPGCAGSFSGGYLGSDLTFTRACSPYVIARTMDIGEKATLVIEAGTVVLLARSASIFVHGRLEIRGTASDPVVLDAVSASSAPDFWSALRFSGTPALPSQIRYATIRKCGWGGEGCVWTDTSAVKLLTMDHVMISDSSSDGFVAAGGFDPKRASGFSMTNCTFRNVANDGFAARTHAQEFVGIGSGNDFGGFPIAIDGGWISIDTAWESPGTPIVVRRGIDIPAPGTPGPATLSIGPGMKLLFEIGAGMLLDGYGHLVVRGTASAPVVFSSRAASPKPGDWIGIHVSAGNGFAGLSVSHAAIEFAGGERFGTSARGGVVVYDSPSEAAITESVIRHNAGQGIYLSCSSPRLPVLTGTTFEANASDIKQTGAVADNVGPGPSGTPACTRTESGMRDETSPR